MVHSGLTDPPAGLTENEQNSGKAEKKQKGRQRHEGLKGRRAWKGYERGK